MGERVRADPHAARRVWGRGAGGESSCSAGRAAGCLSEVEAYDTATNTVALAHTDGGATDGIQAAVCNGAYYIATGSTDQGGGSASAYNDVSCILSAGFLCGSGGGGGTTPIGFGVSSLSGTSGSNPTTLAWGPDGRLYVGYMFGAIRAFTVVRDGANSYRVMSTETINTIANL